MRNDRDKSMFFEGAFITKDGGKCIVAPAQPQPRPHVKYGDDISKLPNFSAISARLDEAKIRLTEIVKSYRDARTR